jgi:hypothetical protein
MTLDCIVLYNLLVVHNVTRYPDDDSWCKFEVGATSKVSGGVCDAYCYA